MCGGMAMQATTPAFRAARFYFFVFDRIRLNSLVGNQPGKIGVDSKLKRSTYSRRPGDPSSIMLLWIRSANSAAPYSYSAPS